MLLRSSAKHDERGSTSVLPGVVVEHEGVLQHVFRNARAIVCPWVLRRTDQVDRNGREIQER